VSKIELMNNEHVALWYHPDVKVIHHQIHGFVPSQVFRELLTRGAEALEEHQAQKWLSDDTKSSPIRPEDYHWGDTVWAPRVIAAGFKYWAIVLPDKAVAQIQMQRFCEEYRARGVTVELFERDDRALAWLSRVDQPGLSGESAG
jgi:hypothetical protein